jgi:thiol-disulfide isomerase/thioredoxin
MIEWLLALVVAGGAAPAPFPCERSAQVQAAMAPLDESPDLRQTEKQRAAARAQLFTALRARFPGDLFVEARRIELELPNSAEAREAFAAPYLQRANTSPAASYLAGLALSGWKTRDAIGLLKRAAELAPGLPQAHQVLADILSRPVFSDAKQAAQHRSRAFALCPLSGLEFSEDLAPGQLLQLLRLLTTRLEGDPGRHLSYYPRYWDLLFQQRRPRDSPQVRARIRQQLQAIERLDPTAHPLRYGTLLEGWKLVGDREQILRLEDQLLQQAPHSERAQAAFARHWEADHPAPIERTADTTRKQYWARQVSESATWVKSWPASSWAWQERVSAVFSDGVSAPAEELPTLEGALQAARDNPQEFAWEWPLPLVLAERLTARGLHLDRVPAAVAAGLPIIEAYLRPGSDYYPTDPAMAKNRRATVMWPVWTLVSRAALKRGNAADAARAVEQLSAILAPLKAAEDWGEYRAELAEARARLALLRTDRPDHKGEALLFLQQSVGERIAGKLGPLSDELQDLAGQLMRAQGGSEAIVKQWRETTSAQCRAKPPAQTAWQPQTRRLPDFRLDALDGKTWSLRELRGKVVFINVWSRACGPCIQELPTVNQLYQRLASQKDAALLSITIDDDAGGLPLFLSNLGVQFPVLLGGDYIDRVLPQVSIPRNWVIDARGFLRAEQVGFAPNGSPETWLDDALSEIDKARAIARR